MDKYKRYLFTGSRKKKYAFIKFPKHPFSDKYGYVAEHRFIVEQSVKRYLKTEEHVHHKNGDTLDNRIENLEIVSLKEHYKKHFPFGSNPKKHINKCLLKKFRNIGWSVYKIGDYLNIGKSSVHRRVKEYGII